MRSIDLATWPRRQHFELFQSFDFPHFNLTAPLDITLFQGLLRAHHLPFTIAMIYLLSRIANESVEFRYRIREGQVVEHERVHPAPTIAGDNDLFSFCTLTYQLEFAAFATHAQQVMQATRHAPRLADEPGRDDFLFMTAIPWVAFTSLQHPIHMHPVDSVPRLSWGKFTTQGHEPDLRVTMPLSVQVHHGLMDGRHVGRFFEQVQQRLDTAEEWLLG